MILPLPREILNIILWPRIVGGRVTVMVRYVKHIDSLSILHIILTKNYSEVLIIRMQYTFCNCVIMLFELWRFSVVCLTVR